MGVGRASFLCPDSSVVTKWARVGATPASETIGSDFTSSVHSHHIQMSQQQVKDRLNSISQNSSEQFSHAKQNAIVLWKLRTMC
jgi:hypothetical protein